jgi:hypothetical protein
MKQFHDFFIDKAATGIGYYCGCADYDKVVFSWDVDADATLHIKFQGSTSETPPNFAAAQSDTNRWDYIDVIDLQDGASVDGDTGVGVIAATDHRMFQTNVDALTYVNVVVTGLTAGGKTTAKCVLFNHKK